MRKLVLGFVAAIVLAPAAAFAADDAAEFARKAAHGNSLEVELGELAGEQAESEAVKQFGARMMQDHSKAQEQLQSAAQEAGIELPSGLDEKGKATRDELAAKSGSAFDRAYMEEMVKDHEKDVELYEKQAEDGEGPVQAYAEATLPTLREHHELAQETKEKVD
jgi:putative membrane protein